MPAVGLQVGGYWLAILQGRAFVSAEQLARGKTKMSAFGAAMRKLVHLCFGVVKTRQPYQAD